MTGLASTSLLAWAQRAAVAGLLLLLGGCIPLYIPPFGSISAERLKEIRVGTTTRQQVVDLLGEPDRLKHEHFSVYDLYSSKGNLLFVMGGLGGAGGMRFPLDTRYYRVLLEFDSKALVKRYEVQEGIPQPFIFQSGGGVVAFGLGGASEVKRVYRGVIRGLFGELQISQFGSVAFSPDGRSVAAGFGSGEANRVWLWDAESGEQKNILEGVGGLFRGMHWGVAPVRFSPDGKLVAGTGSIMPTIWELPSGAEKISFEGHGSIGFFTRRDVHALAFSPDSKTVASGSADGTIKVWEATTGKILTTFEAPTWVRSVAFSLDGKILAAASKEMIFWDLASGAEVGRIKTGSDPAALAFSPDGQSLAVATVSHVEIWRLQREPQAESDRATSLKGRKELVTVFLLPYVDPPWIVRVSVVFSPDGSKIAASAAGAMIGDLSTQKTLLRYFPSRMSNVNDHDTAHDVAFSPDGKMLALATGKGVYVFDVPERPAADPTSAADPLGKPEEGKK